VYLRARYYNPETMQFTTEDPAFDGTNWYAYCGNNPGNRWDPWGLTEGIDDEALKLGQISQEDYDKLVELTNEYEEAEKNNDYAAMNQARSDAVTIRKRVYERYMDLYDYTHGGILPAVVFLGSVSYEFQQGWNVRIDGKSNDTNQRHIEISKGNAKYAQNEDGTPHDKGSNSKGGPPKWLKKKIKEKLNWDWDKNENNYKITTTMNELKNQYHGVSGTYVLPEISSIPMPMPVPIPVLP